MIPQKLIHAAAKRAIALLLIVTCTALAQNSMATQAQQPSLTVSSNVSPLQALTCPATVLPNDGSTSGNARAPSTRFASSRAVYLIKASELAANGYIAGNTPATLGWNYAVAPGVSGSAPLKIYLQNTADVTYSKGLSFTAAIAGMTQVHNATTTVPGTADPFDITFTGGSAFTYTGGGLYVAYDWGAYSGTLSTTTLVACNTGLGGGLAGNNTGVDLLGASGFRPETRLSSATQNDVAVNAVYSYGELPLGLVPGQVVNGVVSNKGALTQTNLPVTLNVTGADMFTNMQTISSLAACVGQGIATFAPFTPAALGCDMVAVSVPADDVAANNSLSHPLSITQNSYSYKYPGTTTTQGVGFTGATGALVAKFTTLYANAVTAVNLEFPTVSATTYKVAIYGDAGAGTPSTTPLYVDAANRTVTVAGSITITLPSPVAVGPGNFYVGIQQTSTTNAGLGFDTESPIRSGSFFEGSPLPITAWTDFSPGGDFKLNIGVSLQITAPTATSVVSRKTHGGQGDFDVPLPGIECRRGGGAGFNTHRVIATFASTSATVAGVAVSGDNPNITGATATLVDVTNGVATIDLANVSDHDVNGRGQILTITLTNVHDGTNIGDVPIRMGILRGDTNADRSVNSGDALQTRSRSGQSTDATNFRSDVNTDGSVNSGDSTVVRAASGDFLDFMVSINNGLSGTVNVPSAAYPSLTNPGGLFAAINANGLSGNLDVVIVSDLTVETGAVALNQWAEPCAPSNVPEGLTVTIRPPGANLGPLASAPTISGTSIGSSLIKFNGADRVTINGSIGGGGPDRSLTIMNGNPGAAVIWIASAGAGTAAGAENNTIKNCNISGMPGVTAMMGILSGSGTTPGNDAEAPNNNNTIQNNAIFRVQTSCYLRGGAGALLDQNWFVAGNTFGSTVSADKITLRGMLIGNAQNFSISNNVINGVDSQITSNLTVSGIQIGLNISGGTINANKISDIKQTNPAGGGSNGIWLSANTTGSNVTIANNFISDVASQGSNGVTSSSNGYGMMIDSGGGYKIYYNSVSLSTNQNSPTGNTAALNIAAAVNTPGGIDLRDNILADTQTIGTRYGVLDASPAGAAVFSAINYNDYFAQNVGFLGIARPTLADWRSATNQDVNSIAADPLFVSGTDLHITNPSPANNAGTPIVSLTTDIDGQMRSATTPDIGADETSAPVTPSSAVSRKVHAAAGAFDINLPLVPIGGAIGIEDRSTSGVHQMVITFPTPVTFTGAAMTSGTGSVASSSGNGTTTATVNLSGVTNVQRIAVTLFNVSNGTTTNDVVVAMGVLIGDATGDGTVNASDVAFTQSRVGQSTDGTNFRADVNASGGINATDVNLVQSNVGTFLPP